MKCWMLWLFLTFRHLMATRDPFFSWPLYIWNHYKERMGFWPRESLYKSSRFKHENFTITSDNARTDEILLKSGQDNDELRSNLLLESFFPKFWARKCFILIQIHDANLMLHNVNITDQQLLEAGGNSSYGLSRDLSCQKGSPRTRSILDEKNID